MKPQKRVLEPRTAEPRYSNFSVKYLVDETLREGVERCVFATPDGDKSQLLQAMLAGGLREFVMGCGPERLDLLVESLQAQDRGEIPQDARFVHILRDGRAAANSILNVEWWQGYEGPHHWQWGELSPDYRDEWERHGRSFVALAAIQWKILMDAYDAAKPTLDPARLCEVRFEDFSADPLTTFRRVLDFCQLESTPEFEQRVRAYGVTDTNFKWREDLKTDQHAVLEGVLAGHHERYSYK